MKTWGAISLVSFRRWLQCEDLDEQKLYVVAVCGTGSGFLEQPYVIKGFPHIC